MKFKKLNDYTGYIDEDEAKKYNMKILKVKNNWVTGTVKGLKFQAQVFNKPSTHGLYKGRISRLLIIRKGCSHWGDTIYHYEKGLGNKPTKEGIRLSRQFLKIFPRGVS